MALSERAQQVLNQWRGNAARSAGARRQSMYRGSIPTQRTARRDLGATQSMIQGDAMRRAAETIARPVSTSVDRSVSETSSGGPIPMMTRDAEGNWTSGDADSEPLTNEERAERDWQEIRDLTIGQKEAYLNDPVLQAVQEYYQGAMEDEGPLSAEVQQGLLNQAGSQAAAAQDARSQLLNEQLARTGGSISDPSAMAAQRQIETDRMRGMQDARSNIALQAALENYDAQGQAAGRLGDLRGQQLRSAMGQGNIGAQYLGRRFYEDPSEVELADIGYEAPSYIPPVAGTSTGAALRPPVMQSSAEPTAGTRARVPSTTPRERARRRRTGLIVGPEGSGARVETPPSPTGRQLNMPVTRTAPHLDGVTDGVDIGGLRTGMQRMLDTKERRFGQGGLNTPISSEY